MEEVATEARVVAGAEAKAATTDVVAVATAVTQTSTEAFVVANAALASSGYCYPIAA